MIANPGPWVGGTLQPKLDDGLTCRIFMGQAYPRIKEIVQQDVASGLIYLNSHSTDFKTPWASPRIVEASVMQPDGVSVGIFSYSAGGSPPAVV